MRLKEVKPHPENATPDDLIAAMEATPSKRRYIRLAAVRALDIHRRIPRPWPGPPEHHTAEHDTRRAACLPGGALFTEVIR